MKCGSQDLRKDGNDLVCKCCGKRLKDYKKFELELGKDEFKKWMSKIKKGKSHEK